MTDATRDATPGTRERRRFPGWRWVTVALSFPIAGYVGWIVGGRVDAVDAALIGGAVTVDDQFTVFAAAGSTLFMLLSGLLLAGLTAAGRQAPTDAVGQVMVGRASDFFGPRPGEQPLDPTTGALASADTPRRSS